MGLGVQRGPTGMLVWEALCGLWTTVELQWAQGHTAALNGLDQCGLSLG